MSEAKSSQNGAFFYENLLAARRGDEWQGSNEIILLTDALVTGGYNVEPYEFINTVAWQGRSGIRPAMVLRVRFHWFETLARAASRKTDADRYHKGWLQDEAAALASLILGIRVECGPLVRTFEPSGPRIGRPRYEDGRKTRDLPPPDERILDVRNRNCALESLALLEQMKGLTPRQSVALVKAARLYQEALWLVEVDAADAWLLLVSAIETAASCWKMGVLSPLDELRVGNPTLYTYLSTSVSEDTLREVAQILRGTTKVTVKFKEFLSTFLPSPPAERPPEGFQVVWEREELRAAFGKIYHHRSKALHDGIGFPFPMTEKASKLDSRWSAPAERPGALSTSTLGGTWERADCPMFFHIFAFIVQNALLSWWKWEAGRAVGVTESLHRS